MSTIVQRQSKPLAIRDVTIDDTFWSPRIDSICKSSIRHQYDMLEQTGRLAAYKLDWKPGMEKEPHIFWDSDVAKWVEAASYCLMIAPDQELQELLDGVVDLIVSAQQPDGYLNPHFTVVEPDGRFTNMRDCHELYCAGHLIEAAVAHYQATGKRTMLDAMCRYADYVDSIFGREPGKRRAYCGHEEIELALIKLYHATGNERYLRLSSYFVDERGQQPHYFDQEVAARGGAPGRTGWQWPNEYNQSHLPVREQTEVVGHSVRAMYLYSAMADLAGECGDETLLAACKRLLDHLITKRMYVTGGIGSSAENEGFTSDYDLPNEKAYAETCASIGLVFWMNRMLQLECDVRYADIMERALYNGVISGVSLDGTRFFYENPLASKGKHLRTEWFDCACCPPNLARLLTSPGTYAYAQGDNEAIVHLYMRGAASFDLSGQGVSLKIVTDYPWNGSVRIQVGLQSAARFGIRLRIPGWCEDARLCINGEIVDIPGKSIHGYALLEREWSNGDTIELEMPMNVWAIYPHPDIADAAGCVALQRGALIYCLEQTDNPVPLHRILLPENISLDAQFDEGLLGGVTVLAGDALLEDGQGWAETLYRTDPPTLTKCRIKAIPYYAWANREPGAMRVWIRRSIGSPADA